MVGIGSNGGLYAEVVMARSVCDIPWSLVKEGTFPWGPGSLSPDLSVAYTWEIDAGSVHAIHRRNVATFADLGTYWTTLENSELPGTSISVDLDGNVAWAWCDRTAQTSPPGQRPDQTHIMYNGASIYSAHPTVLGTQPLVVFNRWTGNLWVITTYNDAPDAHYAGDPDFGTAFELSPVGSVLQGPYTLSRGDLDEYGPVMNGNAFTASDETGAVWWQPTVNGNFLHYAGPLGSHALTGTSEVPGRLDYIEPSGKVHVGLYVYKATASGIERIALSCDSREFGHIGAELYDADSRTLVGYDISDFDYDTTTSTAQATTPI